MKFKVQNSRVKVPTSSGTACRATTNSLEVIAAGFTLLELLVSIAIMAIILTYLYSSFFLSKGAMDALDNSLVRLQEIRMTADMLKREIESAFYSSDKNYTLFRLEGKDIYGKETSSLTLTTFSSLSPGLLKVSYYIDEDKTSLRLRKYSTKLMGRYDITQKNQEIFWGPRAIRDREKDNSDSIILENIESFLIEARYRDDWVRTWDSNLSHGIPEEIRFTITVNIRGKRYAISEVARIRIGRSLL